MHTHDFLSDKDQTAKLITLIKVQHRSRPWPYCCHKSARAQELNWMSLFIWLQAPSRDS